MFGSLYLLVAVLGIVALAALGLAAYVVRGGRAKDEALIGLMDRALAHLAIAKGVPPHQAAPAVFDSSGEPIAQVEAERMRMYRLTDEKRLLDEIREAEDAVSVLVGRGQQPQAAALAELIRTKQRELAELRGERAN